MCDDSALPLTTQQTAQFDNRSKRGSCRLEQTNVGQYDRGASKDVSGDMSDIGDIPKNSNDAVRGYERFGRYT